MNNGIVLSKNLRYRKPANVLCVGDSAGGKNRHFFIPNINHTQNSFVALDADCMLQKVCRKANNAYILSLDPDITGTENAVYYNPLLHLPEPSRQQDKDLELIADTICVAASREAYWQQTQKEYLLAVLYYVVSLSKDQRTFHTVKESIRIIFEDKHKSDDTFRQLITTDEGESAAELHYNKAEQYASSNAMQVNALATLLLTVDEYAKLPAVNYDNLDIQTFMNGCSGLFIEISRFKTNLNGLATVILSQMAEVFMDAESKPFVDFYLSEYHLIPHPPLFMRQLSKCGYGNNLSVLICRSEMYSNDELDELLRISNVVVALSGASSRTALAIARDAKRQTKKHVIHHAKPNAMKTQLLPPDKCYVYSRMRHKNSCSSMAFYDTVCQDAKHIPDKEVNTHTKGIYIATDETNFNLPLNRIK